jgi:hypothetical protein
MEITFDGLGMSLGKTVSIICHSKTTLHRPHLVSKRASWDVPRRPDLNYLEVI